MNSETSTRYGSRVWRHGKARAARAHQASNRRVNLTRTVVLTPDFRFTLRIGPHPFDPLSLRERGNSARESYPLSRRERGTGGEDRAAPEGERGGGVDVRAMGTQDTAHEQRCGPPAGPPAADRPLEPQHARS